MVCYRLSLLPLIRALTKRVPGARQFWYSDHAGVGAKLTVIGEFWTHLCELGPRFGYYPEPTKSILVAHGGAQETVASHFESQRFQVVEGCHYLGGEGVPWRRSGRTDLAEDQGGRLGVRRRGPHQNGSL